MADPSPADRKEVRTGGWALKKMILIAVIALVALGVLGGGGFFAYKAMSRKSAPPPLPAEGDGKDAAAGGKAQDDDEEEEASEEGGGHEGAAAGPAVMVINRQIVNLEGPRKNAFLKCDVHVIFRNQELGKLATSDKPTAENSTIRALVLEALSGKTVEAAMDVETRETLRQEIKDKLNEKYANRHSKEELEKAKKMGRKPKPPIKDVLIVDWAVQQ
jgi:flagellar FliL protein